MCSALKENALLIFSAEFQRKGLVAPEGLLRLLKSYSKKTNETSDDLRHRIYRRLWCVMWFGKQKIGQEVVAGTTNRPTYVYPECVKTLVRTLVPDTLKEYEDPVGQRVYQVTLEDLARADWPAPPKKK